MAIPQPGNVVQVFMGAQQASALVVRVDLRNPERPLLDLAVVLMDQERSGRHVVATLGAVPPIGPFQSGDHPEACWEESAPSDALWCPPLVYR